MRNYLTDFDLTKEHLTCEAFVPPKARHEEIIDERSMNPRGLLVAQYQLNGLIITNSILENIDQDEDLYYASETLAPAALNTAYHGYAEHSDVMRRRLHLPILYALPFENEIGKSKLFDQAKNEFAVAEFAASGLVKAIENDSSRLSERRMGLGQIIGDAALKLSAIKIADHAAIRTPAVAQVMAREQSLITLRKAREMGNMLGVAPSLAQLADPDSQLAVHIRRTAPNGFYQAFDEASKLNSIPV